ncbi:choloylglycine hydrolase, partial [Gordonia sp. VNK21]
GNVPQQFGKHHKFHIISIEQADLLGTAVSKAMAAVDAGKKAHAGEEKVQDLVRAKYLELVGAE